MLRGDECTLSSLYDLLSSIISIVFFFFFDNEFLTFI